MIGSLDDYSFFLRIHITLQRLKLAEVHVDETTGVWHLL